MKRTIVMDVFGYGRADICKVVLVAAALFAACLVALIGMEKPAKATFPGENGKIAFVSNRDGNVEIYTMNADGTGQTRLTDSLNFAAQPAWSPDGTKIAFQSNNEIYTMNPDGTDQINISNNPAADFDPAFSPDGTKIAFVSHRDGNFEIYSMNADGTDQTRLTNNPAEDAEPSWSPDGTKIAFRSNGTGFGDIYTMNPDGTDQTNIINHPQTDGSPNWSPNGTKIAFVSHRDGNFEIYSMNVDGSGTPARLTNNSSFDLDPAWSPDGTKIAFWSDRDGDQEVYVMNADGTGQTNISNKPASQDASPDWQPIDTTPPELHLPENITVNATDANGALVTFEVAATDNADPDPDVTCSPASDSLFPIGTTTVECTATDSSGNTASGGFTVTVKGATDQVTDLKEVIANLNLPAGITTSLSATLQQAQNSIEADNVTAALEQLDAFVYQVKAQERRGTLTPEEAAALISSAEQIKAVLGG